jgi:hypothetical protein
MPVIDAQDRNRIDGMGSGIAMGER